MPVTVEEAIEGKKGRMIKLLKLLEENPKLKLDVIACRLAVEAGLTRYTAKRYIEELKGAGYDLHADGRTKKG